MGSRDDVLAGITGSGGASRPRPQPTSDVWAARAAQLHEKAAEAERLAAQYRGERDALIRRLRADDEKRWSYGALAKVIGCSRELIAQVAKRRD